MIRWSRRPRGALPPATPAAIERKANSLRPGAVAEPLDPGEVTGVIVLTLERMQAAQQSGIGAIEAAAERMRAESVEALTLAARLSTPPPPKT